MSRISPSSMIATIGGVVVVVVVDGGAVGAGAGAGFLAQLRLFPSTQSAKPQFPTPRNT